MVSTIGLKVILMGSRGSLKAAVAGQVVSAEVAREVALRQAVCVRPVLRKVTDRETGEVHALAMACGTR